MKIFLIGYMGCGKSAVGKSLSKRLNVGFIDFDDYIEKEFGKSISEIFSNEGEEKFREIEHMYLKKLIYKDNIVISLGGGTPCFNNNIELINMNGISFYLEIQVDVLVKRLIEAERKRPLIDGMNEVDLKYFIEANLEKRAPTYKMANHTLKIDMQSVDDIVQTIYLMIEK